MLEATPRVVTKNRIIGGHFSLNPDGTWHVAVLKEFAPEYGGGTQVFTDTAYGSIHNAVDTLRGMVTLSPGTRTDI